MQITTVITYKYTCKSELPHLYESVHLWLIHSYCHSDWLSKSCIQSLCVMSESVCPNLKVLVMLLTVSPVGINNCIIYLPMASPIHYMRISWLSAAHLSALSVFSFKIFFTISFSFLKLSKFHNKINK